MQPMVIDIDADSEEILDDDNDSNHKWEDFSDPDLDKVLDDNDDKDIDDDDNVDAPLLGNQTLGIVIHYCPSVYMLIIDPDVAHAYEFPKHLNIIPSHKLPPDSKLEELVAGQQVPNKEECIEAIKKYSMKVSEDYKVDVSKLTLYISEC
ncbi:hypothetical protein PVK06_038153 [Gossypium arboreum]|uniref:Uncharacterized protein n=1 Tax=Gossypium arboreum TaxID=29729 RepID=A0ABR0MZD7_GOSAR|nr:hypothetical protein PVK06_038153 [Gossypium arboreum]